MLFDWFFNYPTREEMLEEINDLYKHILNGTYKIDESTSVDFKEMDNGILATYIIKEKDLDDKKIAEKCDDILAGWEKPAKLLKDDTEVRISFPEKDLGFIYKWDADHNCFVETVTCGDFSHPTLAPDEKKDAKEETPVEIPQHCDNDNNGRDDPEFYEHNDVDENTLPQYGDCINPDEYSFVSKYGQISIIMFKHKWNFVDNNNIIRSCRWYDYIGDFRNGYCVVGKVIDGKKKYGIVDYECDLISDWYDYVDEFNFSDGWCLVKNGDKFNFIDENGDTMFDYGVDAACKFHHGYALVSGYNSEQLHSTKGKWNYVNIDGEFLSDWWFDNAESFDTYESSIILNGHLGSINTSGELFFPDGYFPGQVECNCSGCTCEEKDNTVDDPKLAEKLKTDIKVEKKEIITDETDERLIFMPKSALSMFKDIVNDKSFIVIENNGEDVGISFNIGQLIAEPEGEETYKDIIHHIITEEALMLDRFCKYVKNKFGFSKAVWDGIHDSKDKLIDIVFKIYF